MLLTAMPARADIPLASYWDHQDTLPEGYDYRPAACEALRGRVIGEIVLHGNLRTRDLTVLRELYLQPGDLFDPDLLARDLSFLSGLGIFAAVGVMPLVMSDVVEIHYNLVERGEIHWGLLFPEADYRDGRFRLGMIYRHRSLLGAREELWLEYSKGWEDRVRVSLGRPWLGSLPIDHRVEYNRVERNEYDELTLDSLSMSFWLSLSRRRPLEHRFLLRVGWGQSHFELDSGWRFEQFSSLSLGYSRDTRNSFTRPSGGGRLMLIGTLFDPIFGSSVYQRQMFIFLSRYQTLPMNWVGAFAVDGINRWGDLLYRGVSYLGGIDSIRGYAPGAVDGWVGSDTPSGPQGRNHLTLHGELRHDLLPRFTFDLPLLGMVDIQTEGAFFLDAGYLWSTDRPLFPESARQRVFGYGGAVRLYTPVGDVIRLELGLAEDGSYRFHLGKGISF